MQTWALTKNRMIKEQEYADWSLWVHQRFATKRIPISGSIELTQRCNNQCIHCYNNLSVGDQNARGAELTLGEYRRILDEIADAGCLWLLLTGGEIFIRKDFLDIYTYARQKGFLITLFTNGTLISPEIAYRLAQLPPFSIEITIYGHTKETYESITKIAGSYERCLNGIKLLMDHKLPLKLKTMAISRNQHEIQDMKQFVEEDLGLEFKFDPMVNPRLDFSQSPLDVRLTPAEVVELDLRYPDRSSEWKHFADQFTHPAIENSNPTNLYVCGAGNQSFAIDACGKLRLCVLSSTDSFDLKKGSFKEGWETYLLSERQKKASRTTKCTSCRIKSMCGMCPANSELECADAEAPVDYLCQVAHLRSYALGLPIAPHGKCEYCAEGSRYEEMMKAAEALNGLSAEF
jgi:radical SAM protein with 4Fe4S-binding SPASM domain